MLLTGGCGSGLAPPGAGRLRRRLPSAGAVAAAALLFSSCHLFSSFDTGPEGRSRHDTELRRLTRDEKFDEALELTDPEDGDEIGDELLRLLHRGLLLHYAGRYEESNEALQRAEAMIDDRFTKSVSRAALSLITNDRNLLWLPNDTERLMVNYYGALNYLALGDLDEAAVEARRLSRWLVLGEDDEVDAAEAAVRRGLRYFAGSVFEAAGDRNNASVAYRHVWPPGDGSADEDALWPRFLDLYGEPAGEATDAEGRKAPAQPDSAGPAFVGPPPRPEPGGDVVVLIERGLIAHRVERAVNLPLFPEEAGALGAADEAVRLAAAECVAHRGLGDSSEFAALFGSAGRTWSRDDGGRCVVPGTRSSSKVRRDEHGYSDDGDFYLLRVAWPVIQPSGLPGDLHVRALSVDVAPVPVLLASLERGAPEAEPVAENGDVDAAGRAMDPGALERAAPGMNLSLSDAVTEEFDAQLGGIVVKALARAAAKYAVARGIDSEVSETDETLGDIAGVAANAVGALLERADTRCWHLLPDEVSVVRLRLPPGRHPLTLRVDTGRSGPLLIDLGEVEVRDGSVRVLSARVWP